MQSNYDRLTRAYAEWLEALNYEKTNAVYGIKRIQDFTNWLCKHEIKNIDQISKSHIENYFEELGCMISLKTGTALSIHTLRGYNKELKRFSRYLHETAQGHLEINIKIEGHKTPQIKDVIFSPEEIKKLYESCEDTPLGIRDMAMLSVYYGCGLRRTEGVMLEISDVQFSREMLYVRKGKNYKERYVPMTGRVISDLMEYSMLSRPQLSSRCNSNHFFINYRGRSLGSQSMSDSFSKLKIKAGIKKSGCLHSLRHSIATHLLERGMSLEQIARFLGHSCLESTQIYTHIVNEKQIPL